MSIFLSWCCDMHCLVLFVLPAVVVFNHSASGRCFFRQFFRFEQCLVLFGEKRRFKNRKRFTQSLNTTRLDMLAERSYSSVSLIPI